MTARLVVMAVALAAASGLPGLFFRRGSPAGERIAALLMCLAAIAGVAGAALILAGGDAALDLPWLVPGGRLAIRADAISAMFLVPIFVIAPLGSIYGLGYWAERDHPGNGRKLRFFYGLLTAGLALVVVAHNTVLFLVGWEIMALSAFFAVTTEDHEASVRESGFIYLVATRVSTLLLFAFFALLHAVTGSFDFAIPEGTAVSPLARDALFLLALAGFGLKAGIMPLHLWLPGAHANAPSHVSAVMSGVLIKMGIYGLVRVTSLFPHPPAWWGGLVVALGVVSGVLGVAFAIGQHDLKRLLAYHSVENIGIIVIGLGLALLGRAGHDGRSTALVTLGLAGALLHTWNHGLFKALLFLSAGSVVHATGTREIDALGGLGKTMPKTAIAFIVGAVAISGLPPLNGFVSEYLLYVGMFRSVADGGGRGWLASACGVPALALIGALAVACFVKVTGAVFLGTARTGRQCSEPAERTSSGHARGAHDPPRAMLGPMALLVAACALIGLLPALVAPVLQRTVVAWAPATAATPLATLAPLGWITAVGLALVATTALLALLLRAAARRTPVARAGTWGCGYAAPTPSMQYTASSFAELLVGLFSFALRPRVHTPRLTAPFPGHASFHSHVPDPVLDRFVLPVAEALARAFRWLHWMQQGSVHAYLFYILVALLVSLVAWR